MLEGNGNIIKYEIENRYKIKPFSDEFFSSFYNFQLMRLFGTELGFELLGDPQSGAEPGNGRTNLIWTMVKDVEGK